MTLLPLRSSFSRDMAHWRDAWRLRRRNPRWVVFWDADTGQYGAHRLSRAQRAVILAAATPSALADQIDRAERIERGRRHRGERATPRTTAGSHPRQAD